MAEPPSYEESTSGNHKSLDQKSARKTALPWNIREQVGLSRSQHVASIVSQIVEHIKERALRGLSKTTLMLVPSDQDASRKGELVGFPDGEAPAMIQFEGQQNSMQFWSQQEALSELRMQLHRAVADDLPAPPRQEQPEVSPLPPPKKTSWFGRKPSKAATEPAQLPQPVVSPVEVDVQVDEIYFRSETEYGLYETLRVKVVVATVDVR